MNNIKTQKTADVGNKKLTIFFVTNNYKPYSAGVVSAVDATAAQLRNLGHRVIIITLDFGYECCVDGEDLYHIPCEIKFSYKSNPLAMPLFPAKTLRYLIQKYQPDILHAHHPFLLGSCASRLARSLGIPVVFTLHMIYEKHTHHVPFHQGLMKFIARWQVQQFCKLPQHIIAPSIAAKEYLEHQEVLTPISIIPSGILPIFKVGKIEQRSRSKPFKLLYLGRFVPEKNIGFLLDVFSKLPNGRYQITLAGFGPEYDRLQMYAYKELELDEKLVRFIHRPQKEEIVELYKDADLFLFASQAETQGLVLAESMACGTPVVARNGFAIDDIIKTGVNGMIVDSEKAMIQAIEKISNDDELFAKLRSNAWQTAQAYYPEATVKKLVDVYQMLLINFK